MALVCRGRKEGHHSKGEQRSGLASGPHSDWMALGRPLTIWWGWWPWVFVQVLPALGGLQCRKQLKRNVFKNQAAWENASQLAFSLGCWRTGHHEVHLDVSVHFVLISDALNIKPGFEQTAVFFCGTSCPFETESFSKWMLSSREDTRGEQRVTRVRRVDYAAVSLEIFRHGLYALRVFFLYIRSRLILERSFAGSVWILMGWANFAHINWRFCPQGMG